MQRGKPTGSTRHCQSRRRFRCGPSCGFTDAEITERPRMQVIVHPAAALLLLALPAAFPARAQD
jgi:hypothetical protein